MHIRTINNKYNIPVVIDACEDADFVRTTSNLDWIDINGTAQPGDYYYNNMVITPGGANYNIITDIIHAAEEEAVAEQRAADAARAAEETAKFEAEAVAREAAIVEAAAAAAAEEEANPIPELTYTEKKAFVKDLTKPRVISLFDSNHPMFTVEYLESMEYSKSELTRFIAAVQLATVVDNEITFAEPYTHAPGRPEENIKEKDLIPHGTKEEYMAHLTAQLEDVTNFVIYVRAELGL